MLALFLQLAEQPTLHQQRRLADTLKQLGEPLSPGETLEDRVLLWVEINPEQRVKVRSTSRPLLEKAGLPIWCASTTPPERPPGWKFAVLRRNHWWQAAGAKNTRPSLG